ncbi:MAG TPA: 2-oxoacid:acceptor oxidoreductase family protein [Anaerovoracaceae bacterium]|nr:2-oxoacid:acceptor oxidoreductase family protein [Anaerovoracaceae bacterium]
MKEVVFAGLGGQGVLTTGLVISQIAVSKDMNATWIPQYGSAMRGGTANCTVKFGEGMIYNPSQEEPNILLAMNNPSFKKFVGIVSPGGTVIIDSTLVTCDTNVRDDITVISIPSSEMALEIGHAKGANIIMAGLIAKVSGDFTETEGLEGMNKMFNKKGKGKFEALNTKAFQLGYNFI